MGQTVFCLFCVLSLSFEKLPGRRIKEMKASACAVPHQKASVRDVKIGHSTFDGFCSFFILQHHVFCRTLQKTELVMWLNTESGQENGGGKEQVA